MSAGPFSALNYMIKGCLYIKDDLQYHKDGHKVKLVKIYSEEREKFFFYLLLDNC